MDAATDTTTTTAAPSRGDRLGVRWGLAGGIALTTIDEVRDVARYAVAAGFDSLWISHANAVDPIVALAAAAAETDGLAEVGTSVVPLYGRHPIGVAQLARTAQSALGGRFTLGIGAASRQAVGPSMGMAWDHPLGLHPRVHRRPAAAARRRGGRRRRLPGDDARRSSTSAPRTRRSCSPRSDHGCSTSPAGACRARRSASAVRARSPRTSRRGSAPRLPTPGRPAPRIMALIRICVTADRAAAFALARETATRYRTVPSYAAVQDMEGLDDPAELHLIGSWEQVLDGLARYAEAGVTDYRLEVAAPDAAAREATREALADHLTASAG